MNAIEAGVVGHALAWMATEGRQVAIEHEVYPGGGWAVAWDYLAATIYGHGPDLPAAILDALQQAGLPGAVDLFNPPGGA